MIVRTNGETRHARAFYAPNGLNVATYDSRTAGFPGEIEFYVGRAIASGGPVLEVACGTGRVAWPIARAGIAIVGLDLSAAMLEVAEGKRAAEGRDVRERARFVSGDMTGFDLGETFALALVPFRAFQALLTPEAQRSALACIHRHLRPGGRLVLDVFDPLLELLLSGRAAPRPSLPDARHPVSGNVVAVSVPERVNDPLAQQFRERWLFTERSPSGEVVRQEEEILEMRWSYRYEMRYLLELCGYVVEDELSDFMGAPPAYGREQIWVARRA
jgi:SAM-dependent methyltransferase